MSTVYIQYSRDRFKDDALQNEHARSTLRYVLGNLAKICAPLMPFLSEHLHRNIKHADAKESVHLEDWPTLEASIGSFDADAASAAEIPKIVEAILAERSRAGIPVRQPLRLAKAAHLPKNEECRDAIRRRVNVEHVEEDSSLDAAHPAWIDSAITPELKEKGMVREFTRGVQEARKKEGLKPQDRIMLQVYSERIPKDFFERNRDEILHAVHADKLLIVPENGKYVVMVGGHELTITLNPKP